MTQHTDSNTTLNSRFTTRRSTRLIALAALGLPLGAMFAPTTASAAPGDSFDDIDLLLPIEELPLDPAGLLPQLPQPVTPGDFTPQFPVLPTPVPPTPIPYPVLPSPDGVPGPDDGPGLPLELPELDDPIELVPFDPGDLVFPTGPGDDLGPGGDDGDEPECAEYSAINFDVEVERYDADLIELRLSYSDMDVCDFTVWTAIAEPGAAGTLAQNTVGMVNIAFATDSAGHYHQTLPDFDLCDLEIRVAVEESLPFTIPHTDPGCAIDDGDETPDDGDETPDDGDETPDDGDETPDDGDETPDDGDETPGGAETQGTPGGGLPQTGTDLTTVMLAVGLMTLGAGSVIALATRRREERPSA